MQVNFFDEGSNVELKLLIEKPKKQNSWLEIQVKSKDEQCYYSFQMNKDELSKFIDVLKLHNEWMD
jgi:hypothetical protein